MELEYSAGGPHGNIQIYDTSLDGFFSRRKQPSKHLPVYLVSLLRRVKRFLQVRARCSDTICPIEMERLPSVLFF